jgi:hypothetical protein
MPLIGNMVKGYRAAFAVMLLVLLQGCTHTTMRWSLRESMAPSTAGPRMLAVYEPWFGHPRHISVGYSSQDPMELRKQMDGARALGISGFVVDWYGDREPFIDRSYSLLQSIAAEKNFQIAMMYDESEKENGDEATDDTLAAFSKFNSTYLSPNAPGRQAYLEYNGRPVIFVFPKGGHTDWNRVRTETKTWNLQPLIIYESRITPYENAFDGFYAWINPGKNGWAKDGSNWGEDYLRAFYKKMQSKYPDKIPVGAIWAGFNDSKAAWGQGRFMSQRCGQTLVDTLAISKEYYPVEHPLPFILVATWNDYEEGSAIERGLDKCGK